MKNENAVSPVIGVILMVVITVIIAAILAVFAFGMGAPAKAPETNLKYTAVYTTGTTPATTLTINHQGGDALILKNQKMTVTLAKNGNDAITGLPAPAVPKALDRTSAAWQTIPAAPGLDTLAAGQSIGGVTTVKTGEILNVQLVDVPTGQIISNTQVVVQ
jgi:flagellin-like protein